MSQLHNIFKGALLALALCCWAGAGAAAPPQTVNFQGRLTDLSDNPLDGTYSVTFSLFAVPSGGTALWSETQPSVAVANGALDAVLGTVTPIPYAVASATAAWLQIQVGAEVLSPRQPFSSVLYSMNAALLDGRAPAQFVDVASPQTITGAKIFGTIAATGSVTAAYFYGNGSGLTGIVGDSLGDHTAIADLNMEGHSVVAASTVSAAYFVGNGSGLTGISAAGDDLGSHTASQALNMAYYPIINLGSTTVNGTLTAFNFVGDGSGLTGISAAGDNLGSHTASSNLDMANNALLNASAVYVAGGVTAERFLTAGTTILAVLNGPGSFAAGQAAGRISSGGYNAFFGYEAGYNNTSGEENSFLGYQAGYSNSTGLQNTFLGSDAGRSNTDGWGGTFVGARAGNANISGIRNTFAGHSAGYSNTSGSNNAFVGFEAGNANLTGNFNAFMGVGAGAYNTTGSENSFFGSQAGGNNTSGANNTMIGYEAGFYNQTGTADTIVGHQAGGFLYGSPNSFSSATIMGYRAGAYLTSGWGNVLLGYQAGDNLQTGSRNIIIGYDQNATAPTISDELNIGGLIWGRLAQGRVGIGFSNTLPQAALDVRAASTDTVAQIWRGNSDTAVATMSATGYLYAAGFVGDGSGLTGVTGVGDNLGNHTAAQPLQMGGYSIISSSNVIAARFYGDGSGLTGVTGVGDNLGNHTATQNLDLNGFQITNISTLSVNASVTAASFYGDGSGLTGVTGVGDNLGNHTATQGLNLAGNQLYNVGFTTFTKAVEIAGSSLTVKSNTYMMARFDSTNNYSVMSFTKAGVTKGDIGFLSGAGNYFYGHEIPGALVINGNSGVQIGGNYKLGITLDANGSVGISTGMPQARLDVMAGSSSSTVMAQIWRNSSGVIVSSLSSTGVMTAAAFVGDGSGLTGVVTPGDNLGNHTATQALNMVGYPIWNASNLSIAGQDFSVNGSTLVVTGGKLGVGTAVPGQNATASYGRIIHVYDDTPGVYPGIFIEDNDIAPGARWFVHSHGDSRNSFAIRDDVNDFEPLYIEDARVGVGTDDYAPVARLQVHSSAALTSDSLLVVSTGVPYAPSPVLAVKGDGSLAVGASWPNSKLYVAFAGDNGLILNSLSGNTPSVKLQRSGSDAAVFSAASGSAAVGTLVGGGAMQLIAENMPMLTASYPNGVGIGNDSPAARVDVTAAGSSPADMAQIWRNSGNAIVSSMSATGVLMASRFVGDGSGLTGLPTDNLGDHTASQALNMSGFAVNNVSTLTVAGIYGNGLQNLNIIVGTADNNPGRDINLTAGTHGNNSFAGGGFVRILAGMGDVWASGGSHSDVYIRGGNFNSAEVSTAAAASITIKGATNTGGGNTTDFTGGDIVLAPGVGAGAQPNGKVVIQDGTQGAGKVLTSDASGAASWQALSGDNLGDHTATQALNMAKYPVLNVSTITMAGGLLISTATDATGSGILVSYTGAIVTVGKGTFESTYYPAARGLGSVDLQVKRVLGSDNVAGGSYSTIAGGESNKVAAAADHAFIGAGDRNRVDTGQNAVVVGGYLNIGSGSHSFIGGGYNNAINNTYAVIPGGMYNIASSVYSAVLGGYTNRVNDIFSEGAVILGGANNTVTQSKYSLAAGYYASSYYAPGTFTWNDYHATDGNSELVNAVPQRTVFKNRGGFMVTGSTNTAIGAVKDRGVFITGDGLVGISTGAPQAALDVAANGTFVQIWRNSAGAVVASMTATGALTTAGSLGDNLGNHTATMALQMGSYGVNSSSYVRAGHFEINNNRFLAVLPGIESMAIGIGAGNVDTGNNNVFAGYRAGYSNTNGFSNTFLGHQSGYSTTSGFNNTFVGQNVGYFNTTGKMNSMLGAAAGYANTTGSNNTFMGDYAGTHNQTGSANSIFGFGAGGYGNGSDNSFSSSTLMGYQAGHLITTGSNNILLGFQAGDSLTTGSNNIVIGYDQDATAPTVSNQLNIGGVLYGDLAAKTIGISTRAPQAALDVVAPAGGTAQIWRDNAGAVVASMTATGQLYARKGMAPAIQEINFSGSMSSFAADGSPLVYLNQVSDTNTITSITGCSNGTVAEGQQVVFVAKSYTLGQLSFSDTPLGSIVPDSILLGNQPFIISSVNMFPGSTATLMCATVNSTKVWVTIGVSATLN